MSERKNNNQDNFKIFIDAAKGLNIKGYLTNDVMVLTTDTQLLKNLIKIECENKNKIQLLNTNGLRIDKNSPLPHWVKNSMYVNQPCVKEGFMTEEIGGNRTIVLANDKQRLQKFLKPIINRHIEEFGITMYEGFIGLQNETEIPPLETIIAGENFLTKEILSNTLDLKRGSKVLSETAFTPKRLFINSL